MLRFTEELTLTLRMDGASRLFAGLAATLWPFTMLYAFDYMSHEKHLSMFWSFFHRLLRCDAGSGPRREHDDHVSVL